MMSAAEAKRQVTLIGRFPRTRVLVVGDLMIDHYVWGSVSRISPEAPVPVVDRHPDHLAVNRVVTRAFIHGRLRSQVSEYFVYHRWRLLPRRDIRQYLRSEQLLSLDLAGVSTLKREALDGFRTQTTRYYPWQTRPVLTPWLLDEECRGSEYFLRYDAAYPGAKVFTSAATWIRIAHWLEPVLQKWKYALGAAFATAAGRSD